MDEKKLTSCLLTHSKTVFETMLGMNIAEMPAGAASNPAEGGRKVVALIGFGGSYVGNCMISCSQQLACKMASAMLMSEYPELNDEVIDTVGEIANMIFGNVKTELEDLLGPLRLSIPTVIVGRSFDVRSTSNPLWITIPFQAEGHDFEVQMCVSKTATGSGGKAGFLLTHPEGSLVSQ